jgi:DNA end-binding protein Ku
VLVVNVLYYPAQVRATQTWEAELRGGPATAEELRLARQLIDAASGPLDWSRYRDTTAAELAALVEAKVARRPLPAAADEPIAVLQLLEALKQSVAATTAAGNATPAASRLRPSRSPRRALP